MKIFLRSKLKKNQAWGGGNQFLSALRGHFSENDILAQRLSESDVVLYNSYQDLPRFFIDFFIYNKKIQVYRLGPVFSLHRKGLKWKLVDRVLVFVANYLADGVVFQSKWSLQQAEKMGFRKRTECVVIHNAVDEKIFFKKEPTHATGKRKLVYTSWSSNVNKGFDVLKYIDTHLDFNNYEFTFVGNSPLIFENIHTVPPKKSQDIATILRQSDIFVSPTKDDACSNAILEALSCGLPVVAFESGANMELIKNGGIGFSSVEDVVNVIDKVNRDFEDYVSCIKIDSMNTVGSQYKIFCESLINNGK